MAKINVRSPYFINLSNTNLTSAKLEIEIYLGEANTDWQDSPQYTLVSTAINEKINFEIAELIADYITALFNGTFPTPAVSSSEATTVNVDYKITETIGTVSQTPVETLGDRAFYAYGYFEEGANPALDNYVLQSNLRILKNTNETVTIPVDNTLATFLDWKYQGATVSTVAITTQADIEDQITYVTNTGNFDVDQAVIADGATSTTIDITSYDKCKYSPYKLTFINKFGAYQEIWMFGNSKLKMSTTQDNYKSNILTNGTYEINDPQIKTLTKNAKQRLTLNSDFYPERYNQIFKQLFLSESVWIYYGGQTLGVNIDSKSFNYKTSLTEGLINYSINVSFAFDTINNIR
tara:strand:- start:14055 stop:15104 length:1050 start_codon:yes stop_codon:yes gene_type:complete